MFFFFLQLRDFVVSNLNIRRVDCFLSDLVVILVQGKVFNKGLEVNLCVLKGNVLISGNFIEGKCCGNKIRFFINLVSELEGFRFGERRYYE